MAEVCRGPIHGVTRKAPRKPGSHKSQSGRQDLPQPELPTWLPLSMSSETKALDLVLVDAG